ncbi:peptidoglycan DD-metalloendopeptidase family protein [Achromobacter xylosoxidans]|uniref:M23 family metallopeptidase n=1 Tax=Alcaligenes xylosoxydans xylosoxydans TaxID=85698 RepID=UPI0022B906CA|nr:M23 family metallopeptidase [Achromobacter xylosoxidans]MCZ8436513.1 peptidoglycan DD-metalloendopeptidase family protein [Achromobacter xylosoxidans]MDC6164491.1 peptidoglycan DD-metalloendopeptidase family protein [Achromobacter xylosoxidans]
MHARDGQDGHFTLGGARLALFLGGALVTAAIFGAALQRYITPILPAVHTVGWPLSEHPGRDADFLRGNMNLLAAKVGALQAKLASIDGLGQRVAQVAGVAYTDPEVAKQLASAPAEAPHAPEATQVMDDLFTEGTPPSAASAEELGRQLDEIQERLALQTDNLKLLDAALTRRSADQARMPTAMPITDYPYLSSSYGWRRNPVTGRSAMHEGLDFAAPPGTPILAASGGVVLEAKFHPGYGNMVEIDHGDGLITRYAHASSLMVKQGQLVERGQQVARVGSSGRSTGPHLHFEVRLAGQPLDPRLFLGPQQNAPPTVAQAGAGTAAR